jgi:putative ABC transport system substrate-binding protein
MRRREFIGLLSGLAAARTLAVKAQQSAMPVIGFLASESPKSFSERVQAFHQGLKEVGYVEGQNVAIEYRWADGHYDRLPALAADLVRRQVSVIASSGGTPAALAAKSATSTIPIVFEVAVDPVDVGLVVSLNRPGGNITGVTSINVAVGARRLELMHELVPTANIMALLVNPTNPILAETLSRKMQAAARTLGLQLFVLNASTEQDFETVLSQLVKLRAGGLVIGSDAFFNSRIAQVGAMTLGHAVPTIYQSREFVAAGGLMSYGGNLKDIYRQAGRYAGRVLNGEKPAELPVQWPTKFDLIINLKTAKALSITIPQSIMVLADELIE